MKTIGVLAAMWTSLATGLGQDTTNEEFKRYSKLTQENPGNSEAHYRLGEIFSLQNNYAAAVNEFRKALKGDLRPAWIEVWAHINMGKIFDITGQRERAINAYRLAKETKDNKRGAQEEAAKYLKEPYQRKQ